MECDAQGKVDEEETSVALASGGHGELLLGNARGEKGEEWTEIHGHKNGQRTEWRNSRVWRNMRRLYRSGRDTHTHTHKCECHRNACVHMLSRVR